MRLVIEVDQQERDALRKFLAALGGNTTYSGLFRTLLRLAIDGTIDRKKLLAAMNQPRPILNVTVTEKVTAKSSVTAKNTPKIDPNAPLTTLEQTQISAYMRKHPNVQVYVHKWRQGHYK